MKKKPSPWFVAAFESAYLRVYAHRDRADAERAVAACVKHLEISKGHLVLDLCCGAARHLEIFEEQGFDLVGLDLSQDLLAHARKQLPAAKLVRADARVLPFTDGSFSRLVNLFSSFGYFDDDREHLQMLREMARVLAPGGQILMDHMNPARIIANLQAESREERDGLVIESRRRIDKSRQRVEKDVRVLEGGQLLSEYTESVRLFAPSDFDALYKCAGLRILERLGDFDGAAFDEQSPRQILVAERA